MTVALLAVVLAAATVEAKPKDKYYIQMVAGEAGAGVPAELTERVKKVAQDALKKRKEFVTSLTGAPDPTANPSGFKAYLKKKKLKALSVVAKVVAYERELLPAKEGKTGQILKVHVAVSLLGATLPDGVMALSGDGASTIHQEIGMKVRPRDDEAVLDMAMKDALTQAVGEAATRLKQGKPKRK